jgi:hypothetical protein
MWARKALVILFLTLFILSIFSVVNAKRNPWPDDPNAHPWGEGNAKITTANPIKISDSFYLTFIGNIPVVFKVEVKNQMPFGAKKGK